MKPGAFIQIIQSQVFAVKTRWRFTSILPRSINYSILATVTDLPENKNRNVSPGFNTDADRGRKYHPYIPPPRQTSVWKFEGEATNKRSVLAPDYDSSHLGSHKKVSIFFIFITDSPCQIKRQNSIDASDSGREDNDSTIRMEEGSETQHVF